MNSGFNTDVTYGDRVFHVQTEDRGARHRAIDTVVYQNGRILHRHSSSYADLDLPEADPDPALLGRRVEEQHRRIIESLRSGELDAAIAAAAEQSAQAAGIRVQLLNPQSWLASNKVSLDIEVLRRADGHPEPGAHVEAAIEGSLDTGSHAAITDDQGRARIEFPMPPLGDGEPALVIQAHSGARKDEIRFAMRSRVKSPPPASTV